MTEEEFIEWLKSESAVRCVLVEVTARISGVETTLYLSNKNYSTDSSDTPANTTYLPCIAGGVAFQESLGLDGSPSISYGDIEINNESGVRDEWLSYIWRNRQIRIFFGDVRWDREDFRLVFDGIVSDITSRNLNRLNIILLDKLQRLNNPVTEELLGGMTDNKDRLLPLTFGECHNVTPLLIDPTLLIYKVHNGPIERIIEVRDNGAPITSYTEDLLNGEFTLTAAAVGQITCSIQGDKPSTYINTISGTVQRIVVDYGQVSTRLVSGDLDAANLAAFPNTDPIGIYLSDRANVLATCQELAASAGAQVVMTTVGKLRLVPITLPALGTPKVLTAEDIDYKSLSLSERVPVKGGVKLGYCKNWTVQSSGLAGGVVASSASLFAEEYLTTTQSDATTITNYKLSPEAIQENTLLLTSADAVVEATRRLNLWKTPRQVFTVVARPHLLLTELGDAVTITNDRFDLSAETGQVVEISRDWITGRITLGILI